MGFVSSWLETASSVVRSPSETLRSESRNNGFGYPLKFMLMSTVIAGVLNTAAMALRASTSPLMSASAVDMVLYFVGSVIGGPVVLAVLAGVIHIFAYALGASSGYSRTLAAVEYGTAVAPLAAIFTLVSVFFPLAGLITFLLGLWALQIQARGLQHFHDLSSFRSTVAVLMPIILVVAFVFVSVMAAFGSMLLI